MKNKSFIGFFAVILFAGMFYQACSKADLPQVDKAKSELKVQNRGGLHLFDDAYPPITDAGYTLTNVEVDGDTLYVESAGILDVTQLIYNNTCGMDAQTLSVNGFVLNDKFRVRIPAAWKTCFNGEDQDRPWDVQVQY